MDDREAADGRHAAVGRGAFVLGFAGLLPQAAVTAALVAMRSRDGAIPPGLAGALAALAAIYPLVILSFLGGIWWGFAMHRVREQTWLAAVAVIPSLVAVALLIATGITGEFGWGLVATGVAVLLTLPVDRYLVNTGDAPQGWMALRVPLSLGLGGLAIVAGAILGSPAGVG